MRLLAGCATGLLMLVSVPSALANTYSVTRTDDPTPSGCHKQKCSLREAVIAANTHPGRDTIMLQGGKTYNLTISSGTEGNATAGDLDILDSVTITHTGSKRAAINAHRIDRIFEFPPTTGAKATFSGLVIKGGKSQNGGGINIESGALILTNSVITGNRSTFNDGGGIDILGGSVTIKRSSITSNRSADEGGGIVSGGARTLIVDSTVSGNSSVISGGGVTNFTKLIMRNDTVANNSTEENGGGISSFVGSASLNDVTVARNKAASAGGAGDVAGGVFADSGTFKISNSLIAANTLGGTGNIDPNCAGAFTSAGHNMRTTNDAGCTGFASSKGDFVKASAKIGPLASNGGPTQTIALLAGSPAINRASGKTSEKRDQRGHKRDPKHPDVGAFEAPH